MKKLLLTLALAPLLLCGCGKPDNVFDFSGTMVDYKDCMMQTTSISEWDYGMVISLDTPDSIGKPYTAYDGSYDNCVVLYRTRSRFKIGDKVEGSMYLDDDYSKAYCQYHYQHDLPEGVCYSLK
ncbi:MAG: hypothetical protein IJK84_09395 [Bacteroidales bacterium]|nr:hypothetical protein [Bacteroidales bacterium]